MDADKQGSVVYCTIFLCDIHISLQEITYFNASIFNFELLISAKKVQELKSGKKDKCKLLLLLNANSEKKIPITKYSTTEMHRWTECVQRKLISWQKNYSDNE